MAEPSPPLSQLLALMQAGDLHALDVLAREYGQRLLAVARRRCRCPADAEDAVQQALLAASTSMVRYRGEGSPLSWLSTLVARACYRCNLRAARAAEHGELDVDAVIDERDVDGFEVAARRALGDRLGEALMALSRTDRLALLLQAEGMNSVEIAARFGMTHDAVRSRLKRARRQLRALLADDAADLDASARHTATDAQHDLA